MKDNYKGKVVPENIIEYCREKLPLYAVPKFVEFRDNLPLTLAMKIFKRKLKQEETARMKQEK